MQFQEALLSWRKIGSAVALLVESRVEDCIRYLRPHLGGQ